MNINWQTKKLGEIIKLEYGKPLSDAKRNPEGAYPVYGANGEKDRTDEYYHDKKSIIIGRKGSAGEINLTEEKFWPLDVTYFVTFDCTKYDLEFIYYLLNFLELPKLAKGVKPGINRNEVYSILVRIPPLSEQRRIASILDKAFSAIDQAKSSVEQNIKNEKDFFELYLQNIFANKGDDWEKHSFEKCFKLKSGDGLTSKKMSKDGKYPVFGGNGVAGLYDKFNLSGSNVIIGRVGALCGNVRHINKEIWLTDNAFRVVNFQFDFDHSFLTYLLNYKNLRNFARQAAQPVISNSSLKDVILEFPKSISDQRDIVVKLDALSAATQKLEGIYQTRINKLDELKKSILQKTFSDELNTENIDIDTQVQA